MKKIIKFVVATQIIAFGLFPIQNALARNASNLGSISIDSQSGILTSGTAGSGTYTVTVNRTGNGNLDTALSITTALPTGVTASFVPATVSFTGNTPESKTSTLTLTTTSGSPEGVTNFTVQGMDTGNEGATQTTSGTLTIGAPVITQFTLTYTAGTNGTLSGSTTQTVNQGANGTAVTAVANPGFNFTSWSDATTTNPRTDSNVQSNLNISASFTAIVSTTTATTTTATGSLIVNKVVVGGTATTSSFALFVNGFSVTSGLATTTSEGVHVVSERNLRSYSQSFGGACDSFGNVTVSSTTPAICTITNTYVANEEKPNEEVPPTPPQSNSGGQTQNNTAGQQTGGGNIIPTTQGSVLGASTDTSGSACSVGIGTYMRRGQRNNMEQVVRLQIFLNSQNLGVTIPVTGIFDSNTESAVKLFQTKHASEILTPWGINASTGYVYKTTLRWINHLLCTTAPLPPVSL